MGARNGKKWSILFKFETATFLLQPYFANDDKTRVFIFDVNRPATSIIRHWGEECDNKR